MNNGAAGSPRRISLWDVGRLIVVALAIATGLLAGATVGATTRSSSSSGSPDCPTAKIAKVTVASKLSRVEGRLRTDSTVKIVATGVEPSRSPWASLELGNAEEELIRCLVGGGPFGSLRAVEWTDGDARFDLEVFAQERYRFRSDSVAGLVGSPQHPGILLDVSPKATTLDFELCPPQQSETPLICSANASGVIIADTVFRRSQHPLTSTEVSPFPSKASEDRDTSHFEWAFDGGPPKVSADLDVPVLDVVRSFMASSQASEIPLKDVGGSSPEVDATFDVRFYAYGLSALVALFVGALALRRAEHKIPVVAIVLAVTLMSGMRLVLHDAPYLSGLDAAIFASAGWALVAFRLPQFRRRRLLFTALPLSLAAAGSVLAFTTRDAISPRDLSDTHAAWYATSALGVGLLTLTLAGIIAVGSRLLLITLLLDTSMAALARIRSVLGVTAAATVACALAFPMGSALADRDTSTTVLTDWVRELATASASGGFVLLSVVPLLVVGYAARYLTQQDAPFAEHASHRAFVLALMLVLAVPWSGNGSVTFIVALPGWLLSLVVAWLVLRRWASRGGAVELSAVHTRKLLLEDAIRRESIDGVTAWPESMLAEQSARRAAPWGKAFVGRIRTGLARLSADHAPKERAPIADPGRELLSRGPKGGALANGRFAASVGAVIGLLPVAYFSWATVGELDARLAWSSGPLVVLIGFLTEVARWIVIAFLFGFLYSHSPGRIGPLKAGAFSAVWIACSLAPTVAARALNYDITEQLLYRSSQTLLFCLVLAVFLDIRTISSAGGSWRQLRDVYALRSYTEISASLAPVVLVTLALAQQIISGSGFDVAQAFVKGLATAIG